jgi:hypothetical protein
LRKVKTFIYGVVFETSHIKKCSFVTIVFVAVKGCWVENSPDIPDARDESNISFVRNRVDNERWEQNFYQLDRIL